MHRRWILTVTAALALAALPGAWIAVSPAVAAEAVSPRAFSCFRNSRPEALILRVEWAEENRYALFSWAPGKTLRLHIGLGEAEVRWCWARTLDAATKPCPEKTKQWVIRNNCG